MNKQLSLLATQHRQQLAINYTDQLTESGQLKHFLHIQGLPKQLLLNILSTARQMVDVKTGAARSLPMMRGHTVMNLFFENSTRTRTNFELAAKQLAASVINLDINRSSTHKGETLEDTVRTLKAMNPRLLVVRHNLSGASRHIASLVDDSAGIRCGVLNAGDGSFEHPTQAMLDMFTIGEYFNDFSKLKVVIIGDIVHSRVARSQIRALQTLGTSDIRLVAPPALASELTEAFDLPVFTDCDQAIEGCNIVSLLRIQRERIEAGYAPDPVAYFRDYGITKARLSLAAKDAIVLHPGPINREVEIANEVADSSKAVILRQVSNGIAVRMAVMSMIVEGQKL